MSALTDKLRGLFDRMYGEAKSAPAASPAPKPIEAVPETTEPPQAKTTPPSSPAPTAPAEEVLAAIPTEPVVAPAMPVAAPEEAAPPADGPRVTAPIAGGEPRPLVVMGSSSSEVFDYVFGDQPLYHPYWASSWSARSFTRPEAKAYVATLLQDIDRDANIILNFGPQDIMFSLPVLFKEEGFYDFALFQRNTVAGFNACAKHLRSLGFSNIYSFFSSPITDLPPHYWNRFKLPPVPAIIHARMYADLPRMVDGTIQKVVDLHPDLAESTKRPFLKAEYIKAPMDHHPDYVKIQDVVWAHLEKIPGMINRRATAHRGLYPHKYVGVGSLMKTGTPRPRTCH